MAEVFPAAPLPLYPLSIIPVWRTLVSDFDSGQEQRRQKWLYAKYNVTLQFGALPGADLATLYDFYMARQGSAEAFYYYDPRPALGMSISHVGLYVARGDGATEVFDLPGKSTSSQVIYVDGVEQTVTTDYVILTGGGDGSADRVDFVNPPAAGELVTADFTGQLRIRCRFAVDNLSFELFSVLLTNTGIQLQGLAA